VEKQEWQIEIASESEARGPPKNEMKRDLPISTKTLGILLQQQQQPAQRKIAVTNHSPPSTPFDWLREWFEPMH
jgi:hypothetical protein